jgi:preprotein translocase subunit YajC
LKALHVPILAAAAIHVPFLAHAEARLPALLAQTTGGSSSTGTSLVTMLPLVFIFAVFYLVLIRPQQSKQKKWQQVLMTLKSGDRVVTTGGMRGTIISVKDDSFLLRVPPDNLRMEVMKVAIASLEADKDIG